MKALTVTLIICGVCLTSGNEAFAQRGRGGSSHAGPAHHGGSGWSGGGYGHGNYHHGGYYPYNNFYYPGFGFGLGYYGGDYYSYGGTAYPQAYGAYYEPSNEAAPGYASDPIGANAAVVRVYLPDPEAQMWVEGSRMDGTGAVRLFQSPALQPGTQYTYTVTAAWSQSGRLMKEERIVNVAAGATALVNFNQATPSETAKK